jgi:hypothetical protein
MSHSFWHTPQQHGRQVRRWEDLERHKSCSPGLAEREQGQKSLAEAALATVCVRQVTDRCAAQALPSVSCLCHSKRLAVTVCILLYRASSPTVLTLGSLVVPQDIHRQVVYTHGNKHDASPVLGDQ